MPAPFVCAARKLDSHLPHPPSARVIAPELAAAAAEAEAALARGTGDAHDHTVAALARAARGDQAGAQAVPAPNWVN